MTRGPFAPAAALLLLLAPGMALGQAERRSPRATVQTFQRAARQAEIGDAASLARAQDCLDLRQVPAAERAAVGAERTRQLAALLALVPIIPESLLPDEPTGDPFVLYQDPDGHGQVVLDRVDGEWRFTAATVRTLPAMLEAARARSLAAEAAETGQPGAAPGPRAPPVAAPAAPPEEDAPRPSYEHVSDWLRAHMPAPMLRQALLLEYWQWAGLGVLCLLGVILDRLVIALLTFFMLRALRGQGMDVDPELTRRSLRPFGLLAMACSWWLALGWLGLPSEVLTLLTVAVKTLAALAGVWGSYRLVDIVSSALARKAITTHSKFDDLLVPLVRKTLKLFVVVFGLVFIADTLEFSISSVLAGLGLGGLAFALAAQDTVKNLFGSLTVVLDRPFEVGDWVIIGGVEGTVEEVGFRSTRVRTFYNSLVSLPNANLLTATIDNMGKRRYRRWSTTFTVSRRTTPDQLEALCEGIRELVRQHPCTRKDYYEVWVNGLSDSAIEVLLYVFWQTPDWTGELREKQRLILDMLRLCERLGVELAYPTQTVHVVDPSRADAAPAPARPVTSPEHHGRAEARTILDTARRSAAVRPTMRFEGGPSLLAEDGDGDGGA